MVLPMEEAFTQLMQNHGWGWLDRRKGTDAQKASCCEWGLIGESSKRPTGRESTLQLLVPGGAKASGLHPSASVLWLPQPSQWRGCCCLAMMTHLPSLRTKFDNENLYYGLVLSQAESHQL